MADIKEKIKKLLSLSESPNENEAKSALLKARELMAKHKLTESEFEESSQELKTMDVSSIKWTSDSGRVWMADLCKVISENYCCVSAWTSEKGRRTYRLQITGVGEDTMLCVEVIKFAVGFIEKRVKVLKRKFPSTNPKVVEKSYVAGFIRGLEFAYEEQNEEEWGLVMVKPEEVKQFEESLGSKNVRTKAVEYNPFIGMKGQKDGKEFNPRGVIGTA